MDIQKEDKQQTLYEKLEEYSKSDFYPFHMPGHKRTIFKEINLSPYLYDITEIDGFDNLHHPEEIIKQRLEQVSEFYKSKKSYYLVNGSTCGIMSAISAVTEQKKTVILARNSHKSSYNTVFLLNLKTEYIYPDYIADYGINGGITPENVAKFLGEYDNIQEIAAFFITSPTYEGVVSDIEGIAEILHKWGIPLIVDEAHGAHFSMNPYFPESALHKGADLVIQSLHKTLPSFTQTAMIHIGRDSLVDSEKLERYLAIYQSSSPSYVLMAGIDRCMQLMMDEERRKNLFQVYIESLEAFREKCGQFKYFKLLQFNAGYGMYDYDKSKLVIIPDLHYYNGRKLYQVLLDKYHLQMEMASERYIIAMTSIGDTEDGFKRLYTALEELEREIRFSIKYKFLYEDQQEKSTDCNESKSLKSVLPVKKSGRAIVCKKIREASEQEYDIMLWKQARGKISAEFVYLYPPGIPILAPGEIITGEIIEDILRYHQMGLNVQGMSDEKCQMIRVVRENWKPVDFGQVKF